MIKKINLRSITQSLIIALLLLSVSLASAEEKTRDVMIAYKLKSVTVKHEGEDITVMRVQEKENQIIDFYKKTTRGKVQPMFPFKPHQVETLGEREVLEYLQARDEGDDSILLVDSRTSAWIKRTGMIPGAVNIPFTRFKGKDMEEFISLLEDDLGVVTGEIYNFKEAKTLIMYCNGIWCAQSPTAIKRLLALGYPASKLKYYRGGMQSWSSLGLTVVGLE